MLNQSLKEETKTLKLDEQFYNMFQNDNLEVASVKDRDDPNAIKINKQTFQEQTYHKIKQKEIATQVKDLEWDNRYEWLSYMKQKGNELVRKQEYDQAIQIYMEAAVGLDLTQDDQQKYQIMRLEFQVVILSNLAICYKKKKEFEKAIKFHNLAINCDPQSGTYILKRAFTYFDMGEIALAQKDISSCRKILEIHPNQPLHIDIKVLLEKIDHLKSKQLKTYQKMFDSGKKPDSMTNDKQQVNNVPELTNQDKDGDKVLDKNSQDQNGFWLYYNSFVSFFQRVFGCKRIFDEDENNIDEVELINEDYNQQRDQSQNFLI